MQWQRLFQCCAMISQCGDLRIKVAIDDWRESLKSKSIFPRACFALHCGTTWVVEPTVNEFSGQECILAKKDKLWLCVIVKFYLKSLPKRRGGGGGECNRDWGGKLSPISRESLGKGQSGMISIFLMYFF